MTGTPAIPGAINVSSLTGNEVVALHPYGQGHAQTTTQAIANLAPSGGASLSINDGTHTVAAVATLSITGATVGGTTPNATLAISGGGGATGPAGTVQMSDGADALAASSYHDTSAVANTTTATIQDSGDPVLFLSTSFAIKSSNPYFGLALSPDDGIAGLSAISLIAYGANQFSIFSQAMAGGVAGAPTFTPTGNTIGTWYFYGYSGSAWQGAASIYAEAQDDFNVTHATSLTLRTDSSLQDGLIDRFGIDGDGNSRVYSGFLKVGNNSGPTPSAGDVDIGGNYKNSGVLLIDATDAAGATLGTLSNSPTAGNPSKFLRIRASDGTIYAVPGWAIP